VPDNAFHDGKLADMAVSALRECAQKDQPFWLGVGFIRPHLPFVSPQKYWDLYDPAKIELAPNPFLPKGAPDYAVLPGVSCATTTGFPPDRSPTMLRAGSNTATTPQSAIWTRNWAACSMNLTTSALPKNTIIVLWGDHGWKLGEQRAWCKHSNVENDTRAPLLISVPDENRGRKTRFSL